MPDRYLTPGKFGALAAELRLVDQAAQNSLLEFLERQRILPPIARVRFPLALVMHEHSPGSHPPPTAAEQAESEALLGALNEWGRHDADPELEHPLDRPPPTPWTGLVERPITTPFRPWSEFRTNVRLPGEPPLFVDTRVRTYYHGWQALLLADALQMGVQLVFDTRDRALLTAAMQNPRGIPDDVARGHISIEAPRNLTHGESWAGHFDAVARFNEVYERASNVLAQHHANGTEFTDAELNAFQALQARAAVANAPRGGDVESWIAFLRYACGRWIDWTRKGRAELANEYRRRIAHACRLVMSVRKLSFVQLSIEVGRVGSSLQNTLEEVFPDRQLEAREAAEASLVAAVVSQAPAPPTIPNDLRLTAADVTELLDWLERKGDWKLHLHVEAILKRQFSPDSLDRAALAKEVETMGATFEHLVNEMLLDAGLEATGTLMPKLQRLWSGLPQVQTVLELRAKLASTKRNATRAHRMREISQLPLSADQEIARSLLKAVLDRNVATHAAMRAWPEEDLQEAARVQLTAIMFTRKAITAGYVPVAPPTHSTAPSIGLRARLAGCLRLVAKRLEG